MTRALRRFAFALVPLLLLAGVAEGVARRSGSRLLPARRGLDALPGEPLAQEPNMVGDVVTGWRPRTGRQDSFGIPGGTTVNSRGLRGPEVPLDKPAGTRRVLLLGDSTVFGVMVRDEQTFARVVEERLRAIDPRVEVLNGGAPGWSSWQAARALESRLDVYTPDLVVVATLWSDAQGGPMADAERFEAMAVPFMEASHAFVVLREWVRELRWGRRTEEVRVDLSAPRGRGDGPPTLRVPLPDYAANLRRLAATARADGGDVAFLVLPCVRDPEQGKVGDFRDEYRAAMRAAAGELGAPLADSPAAFLGGDARALFFDDVHPTAAGHRIVGEVLGRSLTGWARRGVDGDAGDGVGQGTPR